MKKTVKKIFVTLALTVLMLTVTCIYASAEDTEELAEKSVFGQIFEAAKAHTAEIFSALTLVGSCALAFSYKNGLLPTLKKGVGGIGGAVSEIKNSSLKTAEAAEALGQAAKDGLEGLERAVNGIDNRMSEIRERLEALEKDDAAREIIDATISEQVSLLYDIFMFSSMPEYQKEAVGRRMEKMRALIAEKGGGADEGKNEN